MISVVSWTQPMQGHVMSCLYVNVQAGSGQAGMQLLHGICLNLRIYHPYLYICRWVYVLLHVVMDMAQVCSSHICMVVIKAALNASVITLNSSKKV